MRGFTWLLAALALCLPALPSSAQDHSATIDFLDVGQGDAILIRSPEGKTALIDAGPSKEIVPELKRLGVKSIDLVVVSHHHADHYGGMDDVIKSFRPRFFLATDSSHTTPHYLKLLRLFRDSGITAIFPTKASRKIELGSVVLTVLPQPPENHEDENENSIGIRVQYGSISMLLTGDSQAEERAYWERHVPDLIGNCTVLKLAHHGSRNGTDARWLSLVKPRLAVISVGGEQRLRSSQSANPGSAFKDGDSSPADRSGRDDHNPQRWQALGTCRFKPIRTGTAWRKTSPSDRPSC